jgi:2-oxoglutarate dehydrogenase E2 component (dihydrolipoamide succinyltransferase)
MAIELKVPAMGESITEVEIGEWLKAEGASAAKDENVVVIESEKATMEIPAPVAGKITKVLKKRGDKARVGDVIGYIEEGVAGAAQASTRSNPPKPSKATEAKPEVKPAAKPEPRVMPAAQRVAAQQKIDLANVNPTGPGGRILKEDVQAAAVTASVSTPPEPVAPVIRVAGREEESVPMTLLRRKIAERLVQAQQTTASLTTFNEVDMSAVMTLRQQSQEMFLARYNIKLGFMSFFVKAVVDALKLVPQINAEIRGSDIVYRNYFDIGIAVGGGKGLVVPVIRNAERLSFAEVEQVIADFGARAKENKLKPEELQGGTFTITNGGIFGSMLSTPILNPPQSGILGMHAIQDRPVARNGQVVIRPIMYVALTYDHRLVDGREAVTFLKRVKDCIENPAAMLLEV